MDDVYVADRNSSNYYISGNKQSVVAISKAGFVCRSLESGRMTFHENGPSVDLGYSISTAENYLILSCALSDTGIFVMHESSGRLVRLKRGGLPSYVQTAETAETTRISACSYGSSIILGAGPLVILRTLLKSVVVDFDSNIIREIDLKPIATYLFDNVLVEFDPANRTVSELDVLADEKIKRGVDAFTLTKISQVLYIPDELQAYSWTMALSFGRCGRVAVVATLLSDDTTTDTAVIVDDRQYNCIGAIRIFGIQDIADTLNETIGVVTFYGKLVQINTDTMVAKTIAGISDILVAPKNNYAASTVLSVIGQHLVVYGSTIGLGLGLDTCGLYLFLCPGFNGALEEHKQIACSFDIVEKPGYLNKKRKQDVFSSNREDDHSDTACSNADEAGNQMVGIVDNHSCE